ncbi:uncharacterized protein BDR25DRAFT_367683 [Lindgomyces ingoldianus]|uniref:Uncharacterized protein n=1 Tax=Lindgomyces ingoldianus TaxID=673940 RepID=A0ACB6QZY6_9PLEO|nr:uncharacterized protein BDR25DRAFT_367683 [Lindgomyces ingoldianus]KAF2471822.1 hypothetical protein BDR25DRAFT_367683 [Lindgomyces ingoldianus]
MTSTTTQQQPSSSRPGRKPKRDVEIDPSTGQKPRKVNSEIRKQQNRIASRNYREKRKRKLQYLQQLIRDQGSTDQLTPKAQKSSHEARTRSISSEYHVPGPILDRVFSSNIEFNSLSSTSENVIDPVLATTTTFDDHLLTTAATTPPFANIEPAWNPPIYEHPAQVNLASWNVPQWIPSVDFAPQLHGGHEDFQFTPPHTQQAFEQLPTPPQQPHEPVPNADLFILGSYGHCRRTTGQSQGISSVSQALSFLASAPATQRFRSP